MIINVPQERGGHSKLSFKIADLCVTRLGNARSRMTRADADVEGRRVHIVNRVSPPVRLPPSAGAMQCHTQWDTLLSALEHTGKPH